MADQPHEADDLDFLLHEALCNTIEAPGAPERAWSQLVARIEAERAPDRFADRVLRAPVRPIARAEAKRRRWKPAWAGPGRRLRLLAWAGVRGQLRLLEWMGAGRGLRLTQERGGSQIPCAWVLGRRMISLAHAVS